MNIGENEFIISRKWFQAMQQIIVYIKCRDMEQVKFRK